MVIGIFGESCTGKSTLADKIAASFPCEVFTGKDYLRLAKNENIAKTMFQKKLNAAVNSDNIIYVISEKEHLPLLPEGALRILVTADIALIKSRFAQRMGGNLPAPVATMLEKKHGCFDAQPHDIHVISGKTALDAIVEQISEKAVRITKMVSSMDHKEQKFIHPSKWRETADPFSFAYSTFRPEEILGYPHAGNDVFHARGSVNDRHLTAYIKSARQKGADFNNEVHILSQLDAPIYPKVLDYDQKKGLFSVTAELPGLRLSTIVGENETLLSLSYMEEYGEALSHIHALNLTAQPQKDRKYYHAPPAELLEQLDLAYLSGYFSNRPCSGKTVFCHGDFHYANILWQDHHISGILDFELSGYGDRDFDIAWAIFLRPGQKFLKTENEIAAFLRGYQKHGHCNVEAVKYYMAQCYVYFLNSCEEDESYCQYIRNWLMEHCN